MPAHPRPDFNRRKENKMKVNWFGYFVFVFLPILIVVGTGIHRCTHINYNIPKINLRYETTYVTGNVVVANMSKSGTTTKIVPITKVILTRYSYEPDVFVINGETEQQDYFVPTIKIPITNDDMIYCVEENKLTKDPVWTTIWLKDGKPTKISYDYYNFTESGPSETIASFNASFTNDVKFEIYSNVLY